MDKLLLDAIAGHGPVVGVVLWLWWSERQNIKRLEDKIDRLWEAWIDHLKDIGEGE